MLIYSKELPVSFLEKLVCCCNIQGGGGGGSFWNMCISIHHRLQDDKIWHERFSNHGTLAKEPGTWPYGILNHIATKIFQNLYNSTLEHSTAGAVKIFDCHIAPQYNLLSFLIHK